MSCQIFWIGHQGFERCSPNDDISHAPPVAWPKSPEWTPLIYKECRASIINTFLAGMHVLGMASLDNLQEEVIVAVLQVMFVPDELHRRGDHGTDVNDSKRQEGDLDARAPGAAIYHVRLQDPPREILAERGEALPLGEHLGRDSQNARGR